MGGTINTYEESGTWTRRSHRHNGYSSGFSPSRDQWRDYGWETTTTRDPTGDDRRQELP